jgi:protein O-GlcNAc transferase
VSDPAAGDAAMAMMQAAEASLKAGDPSSAILCFCAALAVAPADPVALYGLANTQARLGDPDSAVENLRRAVAAVPDFDLALTDLGGILIELERHAEAARALRRSLALSPSEPESLHISALARMPEGVVPVQRAYRRTFAVRRSPAADSAYVQRFHYDPSFSAEEIFRAHAAWGLRHRPAALSPFDFGRPMARERPLRVAYLSADLHSHPAGRLLAASIGHHAPGTIHVTICDTGTSFEDKITAALRRIADRWLDLRGLDDAAAQAVLRDSGIDICVDLSGHTPGNRLPLFARRVAPIQVSWLGYWNTTGLPEMDYLLTCAHEAPPGRDRLFSETVVRLPMGRFCYAIPDYAPAVSVPPVERNGHVTFGCFANRPLHDDQLSAWARILRALPGSRLILRSRVYDPPQERARIVAAFEESGVQGAGGRIDFHGQVPHDLLLAGYGGVDVALDPFPFSGLMTSLEALTMGVPVVTVHSSRVESRQTHAVLCRLGLEDLSTASIGDYVAAAVAFASDVARLRRLRLEMRGRVIERLCDGPGFSRGLEDAYRGLWQTFCDRASSR